MRPVTIFNFLTVVGRTGIPEIAISAYLLRFAVTQHSAALGIMGILIFWTGIANFHAFFLWKPPPDDS